MTDKYIKMKVSDLRDLVFPLWEEYQHGTNCGEDWLIEIPLKLGLIEQRPLTKADIENNIFEDVCEMDVGDWYYYILSPEEIYEKLL